MFRIYGKIFVKIYVKYIHIYLFGNFVLSKRFYYFSMFYENIEKQNIRLKESDIFD